MRIYRNEKTGAIISTTCLITGGAWVEITDAPKAKKAEVEVSEPDEAEPAKPGRKKKG